MVKHVVTATEDHAWFQNGPFEFGRPDDFLRRPLRLVIGGAAIRTSAQKAKERYPWYPRLLGCMNHVPRTDNVHRLVRLATKLPIDSGAMGHGVAARKRALQSSDIGKPCAEQSHASRSENFSRPGTAINAAGNNDDIMTLLSQGDCQVAPNEPRAAGNGDFHLLLY
jgi:hypothetical protein